jgi:hypothetical protein
MLSLSCSVGQYGCGGPLALPHLRLAPCVRARKSQIGHSDIHAAISSSYHPRPGSCWPVINDLFGLCLPQHKVGVVDVVDGEDLGVDDALDVNA